MSCSHGRHLELIIAACSFDCSCRDHKNCELTSGIVYLGPTSYCMHNQGYGFLESEHVTVDTQSSLSNMSFNTFTRPSSAREFCTCKRPSHFKSCDANQSTIQLHINNNYLFSITISKQNIQSSGLSLWLDIVVPSMSKRIFVWSWDISFSLFAFVHNSFLAPEKQKRNNP